MRKKKEMLVCTEYIGHIIHCVYLPDGEKIICIKDFKIVKNADRKENGRIAFYDTVITFQDDNTSFPALSFSNFPKFSLSPNASNSSCFSSYTLSKSDRISKLHKLQDVNINSYVQRLFSQLKDLLIFQTRVLIINKDLLS